MVEQMIRGGGVRGVRGSRDRAPVKWQSEAQKWGRSAAQTKKQKFPCDIYLKMISASWQPF